MVYTHANVQSRAVVRQYTLSARVLDVAIEEYGPNGRGCAHGAAVDGEGDARYVAVTSGVCMAFGFAAAHYKTK